METYIQMECAAHAGRSFIEQAKQKKETVTQAQVKIIFFSKLI
jgi:hypothetical protein